MNKLKSKFYLKIYSKNIENLEPVARLKISSPENIREKFYKPQYEAEVNQI